MSSTFKILSLSFLFAFGFTLAKADDLRTVQFVDVNRYVGNWYQIARNPVFFEEGCVCSFQRLSLTNEPNKIAVYNSCRDKVVRGPLREIRGTAVNDDPSSNARFTVDFGLPWTGQYWIIGLDAEYRFAVVSEPSKRTLYIPSRSPFMSEALYKKAVAIAAQQVDTNKLMRTQQEGCKYELTRSL